MLKVANQHNVESEELSWKIDTTCIKIYCDTTVIKTAWCQQKNRQIDQWDRNCTHKHIKLFSDKGGKAIQWEKYNLFNKRYWNNWTSIHMQINK